MGKSEPSQFNGLALSVFASQIHLSQRERQELYRYVLGSPSGRAVEQRETERARLFTFYSCARIVWRTASGSCFCSALLMLAVWIGGSTLMCTLPG